jgi:hypothetical protein
VKTLTAIACCLGLAGGTAQANVNEVQHRYDSARSLCRAWHSDTYCFVTEHRPTVLRLRLTANHHAERLRIDPPFRHPARLSYSPTRLDRALRFTHRLVARLAREPTPEREPPQPAVSDSPLYGPFMCIHRGEGAWDSNTGNGYYGGLQMDYEFMRSYGPEYLARWGTADRWPPAIQLLVAYRAYASGRGYNPWPNTARACGLL